MLSDDELTRTLRDSDPCPAPAATDPKSAVADRILVQVLQRTRRGRRRTMVLAPAVAVALAGATAGTYAWVAGDGNGHSLDSTGLTCAASKNADAVIGFDPITDNPVRSCRGHWAEAFGKPAPEMLTACVDGSQQGSIQVYPGGPDQCARHRADPYRGPANEQVNLAQFRTELKKKFAKRTCVSYTEFRNVTNQLLTEHDLANWSTGQFQTVNKEPAGACAEIVYYDEPARKIWLGDHRAGDPIQLP